MDNLVYELEPEQPSRLLLWIFAAIAAAIIAAAILL